MRKGERKCDRKRGERTRIKERVRGRFESLLKEQK
jgi:hypothetical protein